MLHEAATPAIDRVSAYKASVSAILDDYFSSGDAAATAAALEELGHPLYSHYFVKRAVRASFPPRPPRLRAPSGGSRADAAHRPPSATRQVSFALDRGAREKEAVALLLSEAFPAVVSADQMAKARPRAASPPAVCQR